MSKSLDKATTLVPIGIDCSVALHLRDCKKRTQAFPFDWNVTPIRSAIRLIQNDFSEFMSPRNLIYLPKASRTLVQEQGNETRIFPQMVTPVVDTKYKILFPHDFSIRGKEDLYIVREKYNRRISRLKNLLKENKKIVFIYNLREPNFWQLEQYRLAKVSFPIDKIGEISSDFTAMRDRYINTNMRLLPLVEFGIV